MGKASGRKRQRRGATEALSGTSTLDGVTERMRGDIARTHARRFECAEVLLRCWHDAMGEPRRGARVLPVTEGRVVGGETDGLLLALAGRATTAFEAATELCRLGFAEQALVVARTLFETLADLHWVVANPELAVRRQADHSAHSAYIRARSARELLGRYVPDGVERIPAPNPPDGIRRMEKHFGKYGTRHWTGCDIRDRVQLVSARLSKDAAGTLWFYFGQAYPWSNAVAHTTSASLAMTVTGRDDDGGALFGYGPSAEHLVIPFEFSAWSYGQALSLLFEEFKLSTRAEFEAIKRRVAPLSPPEHDSAVDAEPCPCGSGAVYKTCHRPERLNGSSTLADFLLSAILERS
jgi:hypothetical protein